MTLGKKIYIGIYFLALILAISIGATTHAAVNQAECSPTIKSSACKPVGISAKCSPLFTNVTPTKINTAVSKTFSFTATRNVDPQSISVDIDGVKVPVSVTPASDDSFNVVADLSSVAENQQFLTAFASSTQPTQCTYRENVYIINKGIFTEEEVSMAPPNLPNVTPVIHNDNKDEIELINTEKDPLLELLQNPSNTQCFPDTIGHKDEKSICSLKNNDVVDGYPNGNFKPEQSITRVEALKITAEAFNVPKEYKKSSPFTDIPTDVWFSQYFLETPKELLKDFEAGNKFLPQKNCFSRRSQ
jgi:hypothetical protein